MLTQALTSPYPLPNKGKGDVALNLDSYGQRRSLTRYRATLNLVLQDKGDLWLGTILPSALSYKTRERFT